MKFIKLNKHILSGLVLSLGATVINVFIPLYLKDIIDKQSFHPASIGLLLVLFLIQAILVGLSSYLISVNGELLVKGLRSKLNRHIIYLPQSYFDQQNTGDFVSSIMNDTDQVREFVTDALPDFIIGVLTIIISSIALFCLDWKLTLAMFIVFPLLLVLILPISNFSGKIAEKFQESRGQLTSQLIDIFRNIAFVKTETAEESFLEKFQERNEENYQLAKKDYRVRAFFQPIELSMVLFSITFIFFYGAHRVSIGVISVGTLISFLVYTLQLLNPIGGLSHQLTELARVKGASKKINDLLSIDTEKRFKGIDFYNGNINYQAVNFSYHREQIRSIYSQRRTDRHCWSFWQW